MEESVIMAFIREYLWLWVVVGMVFVSVVISIIFLFICKCMSRKGKHEINHLKKEFNFKTESNKYQERSIETGTPPLPPRTQFLMAEAQSYENLAEESQSIHDYEDGNCEQDLSNHEESIHDYEDGNCEQDLSNHEESIHDYEDGNCEQDLSNHEESIHDYEESTELQADYVKMEGDIKFPPPPVFNSMNGSVLEAQSYENLAEENDYVESMDNQPDYVKVDEEDQAGDNTSTEDYDDIGGEEQDEEDYDDVG
ncbi:apoptosis regulatory protein Siva [Sarotherodon galilaeus]